MPKLPRWPDLLTCLVPLLTCLMPLAAVASDPPELPHTAKNQIEFTEPTTRAFDRSGRHVTSKAQDDGSIQVEHNGSFQNVTVARIGPDGAMETYCTTDEESAKNWMAREDGSASRATLTGSPQKKSP